MQSRVLVLALVLVLAACGDNSSAVVDLDAGVRPDAEVFMLCGNGLLEGSEECDDGGDDPDDGCSATCRLECGDGAVTGDELCDTAIASGAGACPTEAGCTDDDPCTAGVFSGEGCQVRCEFAVTTALIDGDGCCPSDADATEDDDCDPVCGNGVLEVPEACDTAIPNGAAACPSACDDGEDCTADALVGALCTASCTATEITEIGPVDGCCPDGAIHDTDTDCPLDCGDGEVTGTETCDTAITTGPGVCPTECDDGDACTLDDLVNEDTCRAACTTSPIGPGADDDCCPAGADLSDDPDCPAACGDGVITPPETCDDDNDEGGDGCSATCRLEPVGFRFTDLDLKDPHVWASVPIFGCTDVTDFELFGIQGVNPQLESNIQADGDEPPDGLLDLSIANTFSPLEQDAGESTASDLTFPDCTSATPTSCELPMDSTHISATATNLGSAMTCLEPVADTTDHPVISSTAPSGGTCYSADAGTVTFDLGGIPITLTNAKIGGEWFGNPATEIRDGLISGFMSEEVANNTIIPDGTTGIESIDDHALSSLLRGGVGSCSQPSPATGNKDTIDGVVGWMFYLNFSAARVAYTEL